MKKPDLDIPGDLIEHLTARAAVLSDLYRQLSDSGIAASVITALVTDDAKAHQRFLDDLKPDRWPLGRLDLCIRILDYVKREIAGPPRNLDVWVIREPLTLAEQWQLFFITWRAQRRGEDTTTRQAPVWGGVPPALPMGTRTIVPDGPYRDALEAAGLLEKAVEQVRDIYEVDWPTGGRVTLCLP
ncbi:hypothetical protein [Tabrizicola flagellatus]|uniref:hypothetical protein n=1 Tax=Tabrizicola flagellatus TaxID=2593021 RepID=UPI0011F40447|nr:hypothetical protein [Tabrizicola flagellatus]